MGAIEKSKNKGVIKALRHYAIPPKKQAGICEDEEVDLSGLIPKTWLPNYDELEHTILKPSTADGLTCQGGCTDGEYLYRALIDNNDGLTRLEKLDLNTGEVILTVTNYSYTHANDMCYCSKDGYLYIAHGSENNTTISKVNRNTLNRVESFTIGSGIWSIAFNEVDDLFIVGISGGYYFTVYDFKWSLVYRLKPENVPSGYVKQSIHCDDNYIYGLYFDTINRGGIVNVCTWNGMFVKRLSINSSYEPEFIAVLDNFIYVGMYEGRDDNNIKHNSIIKAEFDLYKDVEGNTLRPTDVEGGIRALQRLPEGTPVCLWRGESYVDDMKIFSSKVTPNAFRSIKFVSVGSNQFVTEWFKGGGIRLTEVNVPDNVADTQHYTRECFMRYDSENNKFTIEHNIIHRYRLKDDGVLEIIKEDIKLGNTTLNDFIYVQQIWGIV